jgi:hypothetical protein
MEVLLLAERARRAILACEASHGERIAAIMEAITWGNASALSSVFFARLLAAPRRLSE